MVFDCHFIWHAIIVYFFQLAQMKSEDPLPLRRAKITQEAALKRAEKARKPFAEATAKAEEEREKASQAQVRFNYCK